jgi:hypothetical protein
MPQGLTRALILEYDDDIDDDNDHHKWGNPNVSLSESIGELNLITCSEASERVEDLFLALREVSVTENELPSDENVTIPVHQCVIEKSLL